MHNRRESNNNQLNNDRTMRYRNVLSIDRDREESFEEAKEIRFNHN
jgi:hypothetical protein